MNSVSMGKYYALMFAGVFGAFFMMGLALIVLVAAGARPGAGIVIVLGMGATVLAAWFPRRFFLNDEQRELEPHERRGLIWCGVAVSVGFLLLGEVILAAMRPFGPSPGRIFFNLGFGTLFYWFLYWLAFLLLRVFRPYTGPTRVFAGHVVGTAGGTPGNAAAIPANPTAARGPLRQRVLVLGSGGREHALAWKLAQSSRVAEVLVAPGNAGTAGENKCRNVAVDLADLDALVALAKREAVDLTVVGPEGPLVAGVVDRFRAAGLRIFGPTAAAAQLEGSKAYAKDFMVRHGIPTAGHAVFTELEPALAHVRAQGAPIVIKADGLAAGKGVVVAMTLEEAEAALTGILAGAQFGLVGNRVVVEEFLAGEEASFICIVDGRSALPMATSQDHKRIGDGDTGANTGGMGAYSPAPVVSNEVHSRVMRDIVLPTVRGMAADGIPFSGFLFAGLMIGRDGAPKVIEFNTRFGDPEAQAVLMRLQSDLLDLLEAALEQRAGQVAPRWNPRPALAVVMAAGGYPGTPRSGDEIRGLNVRPSLDVKLFHGGTRRDGERTLTAGGRVLTVCALGGTLAEARMQAYDIVAGIGWDGEQHRSDIGHRALPAATTQAVV